MARFISKVFIGLVIAMVLVYIAKALLPLISGFVTLIVLIVVIAYIWKAAREYI